MAWYQLVLGDFAPLSMLLSSLPKTSKVLLYLRDFIVSECKSFQEVTPWRVALRNAC